MFWNNSRTFYNYLKSLPWLSSTLRNRNRLCQHTATLFFDLAENTTLYTETMLKTASELLDIIMYNFQHKIWSQVQAITHTVLSRKQSPGVSNLQRGWSCEYIFTARRHFWTPGQNELIVWKMVSQMFSLASRYHVWGSCALQVWGSYATLMLHLTDFEKKKNSCFAV